MLAIGRRYLEERAAPVAAFRRWLTGRIRRAAAHHGTDPAALGPVVDRAVATWVSVGLLDDASWAAARAATLRRRGGSSRGVRAALVRKGVPTELVESVAPVSGEADLEAARRYARAHRLGPWRTGPADDGARRRELARLGRRGFSYEVAKRVLDGG